MMRYRILVVCDSDLSARFIGETFESRIPQWANTLIDSLKYQVSEDNFSFKLVTIPQEDNEALSDSELVEHLGYQFKPELAPLLPASLSI